MLTILKWSSGILLTAIMLISMYYAIVSATESPKSKSFSISMIIITAVSVTAIIALVLISYRETVCVGYCL